MLGVKIPDKGADEAEFMAAQAGQHLDINDNAVSVVDETENDKERQPQYLKSIDRIGSVSTVMPVNYPPACSLAIKP